VRVRRRCMSGSNKPSAAVECVLARLSVAAMLEGKTWLVCLAEQRRASCLRGWTRSSVCCNHIPSSAHGRTIKGRDMRTVRRTQKQKTDGKRQASVLSSAVYLLPYTSSLSSSGTNNYDISIAERNLMPSDSSSSSSNQSRDGVFSPPLGRPRAQSRRRQRRTCPSCRWMSTEKLLIQSKHPRQRLNR
jgi:hypothetical protein